MSIISFFTSYISLSIDLLTPLGGVLSYCSLLRIAFDAIFGALLFL